MVRRRQTAIVLASVLLLVSSGVGMAVTIPDDPSESDFQEWYDYEDGTSQGWGGVVATQSYDGQYSVTGDGSGNRPTLSSPNIVPEDGQTIIYMRVRQNSWNSDGFQQFNDILDVQDSGSSVFSFRWGYNSGSSGSAPPCGTGAQLNGADGEYICIDDFGTDKWENVIISYNTSSASVYTWDAGSTAPAQPDGTTSISASQADLSPDTVVGPEDGIDTAYLDEIGFNQPDPTYNVSGRVRDADSNDYLSGVSIEVYDTQTDTLNASATTNSIGQYDVGGLENGTYLIWANKTGYQNENRTITVDGEDQIQNFALASFNGSINLRARNFMDHGESTPYSVIVTIDGDRKDVTDTATVTSSNTSVVTVDASADELVATSNIDVNDRVTVTAEYTDQNGNVYVTQQNVTVANETVENIGILPTASRFTASIDDQTIQAILVATGFGAAAALIASSFAGLGATTLIMTIAWLADYVGDGMIIVTVLVALFVGLNMALNIDYTVTKGG